MTQHISSSRAGEFTQLKQLIVDTIRENDVYEREESVRTILTKQTNTLKDCKFQCFTAVLDQIFFIFVNFLISDDKL